MTTTRVVKNLLALRFSLLLLHFFAVVCAINDQADNLRAMVNRVNIKTSTSAAIIDSADDA